MACPCYTEDDNAGVNIVNDIKQLCKKMMGLCKKKRTDTATPAASIPTISELKAEPHTAS